MIGNDAVIEILWEKLMDGEPEPDHEITASDINRQTLERLEPQHG